MLMHETNTLICGCLKTEESEYFKIDILRGTLWLTYDNLLLNHPEYVASKRFADSSRVGWYHIYGPKIDEFKTWIPIAIWRETSPQCSTFRQRHVRHTNHQKNSPFVSATEVAARQCCHGAAAGDGAGEGHSVAVGAASPAGGKPRRPGEMEPTRLGNLRPKTGKRWNMRSKSLAKWRFGHLKFGDSSNQQQVWGVYHLVWDPEASRMWFWAQRDLSIVMKKSPSLDWQGPMGFGWYLDRDRKWVNFLATTGRLGRLW